MKDEDFVQIKVVESQGKAEIIKNFLEKKGIRVWIKVAEGGESYFPTISFFTPRSIQVPKSKAQKAKKILEKERPI